MKKFYGLLILSAFVLATATSSWALWGSSSVEGAVKAVSANGITVTSKSNDGMRIQDVSLEVNDQTKLNDLGSVTELKEGDQIKVDYKEDGNKKIATSVAKLASASGAMTQKPEGTPGT